MCSAEIGNQRLFATAPATGETVRVSIGWKIDWDAAVPMMEALKLK